MEKELYKARLRNKIHEGYNDLNFELFLEIFGKQLNANSGLHLDPREAVWLYLVQEYGWTIDYCRSLSLGDLRLILSKERLDWKVPAEYEEFFEILHRALDMLE